MFPSPTPGHPRPPVLTLHVPGHPRATPVTDPYVLCFCAVCAALMGKPGLAPALRAIAAAKLAAGEARHV